VDEIADKLVATYLNEAIHKKPVGLKMPKVSTYAAVEAIRAADSSIVTRVVVRACWRLEKTTASSHDVGVYQPSGIAPGSTHWEICRLVAELCRKNLPFTVEDVNEIWGHVLNYNAPRGAKGPVVTVGIPLRALLRVTDRLHSVSGLRKHIVGLRDWFDDTLIRDEPHRATDDLQRRIYGLFDRLREEADAKTADGG